LGDLLAFRRPGELIQADVEAARGDAWDDAGELYVRQLELEAELRGDQRDQVDIDAFRVALVVRVVERWPLQRGRQAQHAGALDGLRQSVARRRHDLRRRRGLRSACDPEYGEAEGHAEPDSPRCMIPCHDRAFTCYLACRRFVTSGMTSSTNDRITSSTPVPGQA